MPPENEYCKKEGLQRKDYSQRIIPYRPRAKRPHRPLDYDRDINTKGRRKSLQAFADYPVHVAVQQASASAAAGNVCPVV